MIETPEDKEEFQLRGCRPGTETEETDPGTGREAAAEGGIASERKLQINPISWNTLEDVYLI